jgi:predicted nucleic acid-binding protein
MTTFVDTNVLIYLLDSTSEFHQWAKDAATERRTHGPLIISDIVYSELSVTFASVNETDKAIQSLALERYKFSDLALFRAGKAYLKHRQNGGKATNVLSDFLIGAQAEAAQAPLLTNNSDDYKSYFPAIALIHPKAAIKKK